MKGWLTAIAVLVVSVAGWSGFRIWLRAGEATTLIPRFDGDCAQVDGYVGAEDVAFDRETGLVYLAAHDRRAFRSGDDMAAGGVFEIAWDDVETDEPAMLPRINSGYDAYGLGLFVDDDGTRALFLANRGGRAHTVERWTKAPGGAWTLQYAIVDPLIVNPNDVLPISTTAAYVTLDKASPRGSFGEAVEGALERQTGKVLFVETGQPARVVAEGLRYANGIAASPDGRTVYVAETTGRAIAIYDRDSATNDLKFRERVFLGTGVDNLTVDAEGRVFAAAHPKLLTFALGHARNARKLSPSQVVMIDPAAKQVDQLYLTLGEDLSAASVALVDVERRRMLLGSIFEPHILNCDLPEVWRHSEAYPAARPKQRGEP